MANPGKRPIDVVVLCGGRGARLKGLVSDRPKPMLLFNGRPFLSMLIEHLGGFGFKRFILCTGYKGGVIRDFFRKNPPAAEIVFSHEKKLLGTGGALKNAFKLVKSQNVLVVNGDSFCALDFNKFQASHSRKNALLSIALIEGCSKKNCGKVLLRKNSRITGFQEKAAHCKEAFCNAGVYLMRKSVFAAMPPAGTFSLEYDLFPSLCAKRCFGFVQRTSLIDFGTPQTLKAARRLFSRGLNKVA